MAFINYPQAMWPMINLGSSYAGYKLYTYTAGTTTPKTTWSDYTLDTANANPIVLDHNGWATAYLSGDYKFVLKTAGGTTVSTVDNVNTVTITAAAKTILDDTTVAAMRTTLGLGTAALTDTGVASGNVPAMDATGYPAADGSQITNIAASAMPRGTIGGMNLSNGSDASHDITISIGECRDDEDGTNMALSSAMTKQIDSAFAAGNNAGGMFTGTVAATTWYHVFIIQKDSDDSIDAGFDISSTGANVPTGYTEHRRVGSVLTDGSANILAFVQVGETFLWKDPPLDINVSDQSTTAVTRTLSTPKAFKTEAIINVYTTRSGANHWVYISSLDATDEEATNSAAPLASIGTTSEGGEAIGKLRVLTNTASAIRTRSNGASTTVKIATLGYTDYRGKFD